MLKRVLSYFILIAYTAAVIGTLQQRHFCMGKLVGNTTYHSENEKCPTCGMKKKLAKGCCKDEYKFLKLKHEHNKLSQDFLIKGFTPAYIPIFEFGYAFYKSYTQQLSFQQRYQLPPPLLFQQAKRFIFFRCILI